VNRDTKPEKLIRELNSWRKCQFFVHTILN